MCHFNRFTQQHAVRGGGGRGAAGGAAAGAGGTGFGTRDGFSRTTPGSQTRSLSHHVSPVHGMDGGASLSLLRVGSMLARTLIDGQRIR
jgi:hypothetical protein